MIKTDISNITEQEFRIIAIRLIAGLEKGIEDSRESIVAEIKELKNAINEVQNKMKVATAWTKEAEGRTGELEGKIMEEEETEKREIKKIQDHEGRIREMSDSIKWNNICIIGIPEKKEKGAEGVLEQIIAQNFPNVGKETGIEIQEAQRTPFRRNVNLSSATYHSETGKIQG